MKILILGGYGVFGGRLAELLADMSSLEILVCGRSRARAEAFCTAWRGQAQLRPLMLDRRDIADALRIHKPDLVVDASGPFQTYGSACYGVITACIDAGIDYLDFADAADFVFGVSQFDERAKAAGVFVLSGVSSFPVLTAAVLREMERTMDILAVEGGIAPSPYAGIGLNVMRAVVGYAGAPVKLWRHGGPSHGVGLAESRRFTVAVPGRLPLRNIHFSLVDVPDLQVIPPEHPSMTDIWMGAGPVPEFLHRMLNLLAKARARFGLPSFAPLSPLFHAVLNRMRFGEHRGGMFVRAQGRAAGRPMEMSWHLLAEGDDGPYIPSMAIEAIVRKMLSGERPLPGARAGTDALNLADYDRLFRSKTIYTGFRREEPDVPLFRQLLGPAFDDLPPRLRELHDSKDARQWSGVAEIRRGQGMLARMISALVGFPQAAKQVPVSVTFTPEKGKERWTRNFGGRRFSSTQSAGMGKDQYLLAERFGIVTVALALVLDGGRLALIPRRWHVLGVPLPGFLLPKGRSFESEENGRFHFDVEISLPFIGLVVAYKGTLEPVARSVEHRGPGETLCGASPGEEA
ncbi:SDR family oxidoreductase [Agrobacterium deltaense]|uniref:SDR family oxidoreductase n=1 Tax=Agrobacterium deltaense TaxID=1183412 RepID=UPI000F634E3B|nr:SDR family oxidoreductase [Agrobacterium deltaense]RRN75587.1 SDR family NAD(P)-dependent oxidoreductase [Agrobacterium deltaense]